MFEWMILSLRREKSCQCSWSEPELSSVEQLDQDSEHGLGKAAERLSIEIQEEPK